MSGRPRPYRFRQIPTLWADYTTGFGVMHDGTHVRPAIGYGRKNPNLGDMLNTAASAGAERIIFTGKVPRPEGTTSKHWLLARTDGWRPGFYNDKGVPLGHWLSHPPTGRFERIQTGQRVEVRIAEEWFGEGRLTPAQARNAWDFTEYLIGQKFKDPSTKEPMKLGKSPASSGRNLWAASWGANTILPPISKDIADVLHATSGQHHLEHLVAGPSASTHEDCIPLVDPTARPRLDRFAYIDGRFMYASLGWELGIGPGQWLRGPDCWDLLQNSPFARARFYVEFTVPQSWNHVGILGVQHAKISDGWFYPNRPGAKHRTWADSSEVAVALQFGWQIDIIEGIYFPSHFMKGDKKVSYRPADNFLKRLKEVRESIETDPEASWEVKRAASAAVRAMTISTIGSWASRGKGSTQIVYDLKDIPSEFLGSYEKFGDAYAFKVPAALTEQEQPFYHPELAVQIWGRGRARVLWSPTALDGVHGGALSVPADTLLGINGDAIYTTVLPDWAKPVQYGGGDDGRIGRLRVQGVLQDVKTPVTLEDRHELRAKAGSQSLDAAVFSTEYDGFEE